MARAPGPQLELLAQDADLDNLRARLAQARQERDRLALTLTQVLGKVERLRKAYRAAQRKRSRAQQKGISHAQPTHHV